MRWGAAVSLTGQTGQSDEIHSPDAWARTVYSRMRPDSLSMEVVWTVAISCLPRILRTMSRPPDRGAYRNVRSSCCGNGDRMVATKDFSGFVSSACALARAVAMAPIESLNRCMEPLLPAFGGEEVKADRP